MISIIDDIGRVVQAMRNTDSWFQDYDDTLTTPPFFFNGRRKEIVNKVINLEKVNSAKIFPMIALNGDIQYTRRGTLIDYKLNLLLAISTKPDYSTEDRENINYIPTLYPLYDSFLQYFNAIGLFQWDCTADAVIPPHQPINRYYYGTSDADGNIKNMFNEPVDAIELVNLEFSRDIRDEIPSYYVKPPYDSNYA